MDLLWWLYMTFSYFQNQFRFSFCEVCQIFSSVLYFIKNLYQYLDLGLYYRALGQLENIRLNIKAPVNDRRHQI